jgi:Mg2+/Co2+ transporter CorB
VVFILAPLTNLTTRTVRLIMRLFKINFDWNGSFTIEELRGAIELHQGQQNKQGPEQTDSGRHERAMLHSVLDLADMTVGEVMTHRKNVVMIDAALGTEAIIDATLASPYTRLPLYQGDTGNIVGVIHSKLLMRQIRQLGDQAKDIDILSLVAKPWFIPETTTLFQQLHEFRVRKEHFALVVDEYGAFEGIVTLEDILEEIVGQIDDEKDREEPQNLGPMRYDPVTAAVVVDGTMTVRDINREFDWELPDENYTTIAGLVLYESRSIPDVGQVFTFFGYRFEILGRMRHQITQLRITPPAPETKA